jgi:hypothetical protein
LVETSSSTFNSFPPSLSFVFLYSVGNKQLQGSKFLLGPWLGNLWYFSDISSVVQLMTDSLFHFGRFGSTLDLVYESSSKFKWNYSTEWI